VLENTFKEVYLKFKLNFYRGIFERLQEREGSLSASEAYAVEVIHALNRPSITQFADFLCVSKSNATYKVNTLVKKGYVQREQSDNDKREFHLCTTDKFLHYYAINQNYIDAVMRRIKDRFSTTELEQFEKMLSVISRELMPETATNLTKFE